MTTKARKALAELVRLINDEGFEYPDAHTLVSSTYLLTITENAWMMDAYDAGTYLV